MINYPRQTGIIVDIEEPKMTTETETKRYEGKIVKVHPKGYIFISCPDIPFTRIFGHWSQLIQGTKNFTELEYGMKVEFEKKDIPDKGTRAVKIKVIE